MKRNCKASACCCFFVAFLSLIINAQALTDLDDLGKMTEIAIQIPQLLASKGWVVATGGPCEDLFQTKYDPWPGVVCQKFGGKYFVTEINISGWSLTGVLVSSFQDLPHLTLLDVSNNHFTGYIPDAFGKMPAIKTLNLQKNWLFGKIPEFTTSLNTLQTFQAQENALYGALPSWLSTAPAATINVSCNCFESPPAWCSSGACRACDGYETPAGVTCDIFSQVFNTGVSFKNAYNWLLNVNYPSYTLTKTKGGVTATVTLTPESISEVDPNTGAEVFRYDIQRYYGPWGLSVKAPAVLVSLLYSNNYSLTLINGAQIRFSSSFSPDAFNFTFLGHEWQYDPGVLKLGFYISNWIWTRPLQSDSLRLNLRVTGTPEPYAIEPDIVSFGDPTGGSQAVVISNQLEVGAYFQNYSYTGPSTSTLSPVSYTWSLNDSSTYFYVYFPRFQSNLAYDPNFGVLTDGDNGDGDGASGDGGDGQTIGIAVGVAVPVVLLLTLLVVGVGLAVSIWQRKRILTRLRGLGDGM